MMKSAPAGYWRMARSGSRMTTRRMKSARRRSSARSIADARACFAMVSLAFPTHTKLSNPTESVSPDGSGTTAVTGIACRPRAHWSFNPFSERTTTCPSAFPTASPPGAEPMVVMGCDEALLVRTTGSPSPILRTDIRPPSAPEVEQRRCPALSIWKKAPRNLMRPRTGPDWSNPALATTSPDVTFQTATAASEWLTSCSPLLSNAISRTLSGWTSPLAGAPPRVRTCTRPSPGVTFQVPIAHPCEIATRSPEGEKATARCEGNSPSLPGSSCAVWVENSLTSAESLYRSPCVTPPAVVATTSLCEGCTLRPRTRSVPKSTCASSVSLISPSLRSVTRFGTPVLPFPPPPPTMKRSGSSGSAAAAPGGYVSRM
ncbi:hypothetical protein T484DRAFT_1930686 [Baffinella frigidus]|nr:hypothetical protein T484DRAFT_1930686 [Cryptophyta sp. CCMP2293]|mmetsp:Transcript_26306/g.62815  ORF Transcript_26306/g.62815 Transcript_26306/m.62815 type:complete len:373 (+) Transcript_26306:135-1253(+)